MVTLLKTAQLMYVGFYHVFLKKKQHTNYVDVSCKGKMRPKKAHYPSKLRNVKARYDAALYYISQFMGVALFLFIFLFINTVHSSYFRASPR